MSPRQRLFVAALVAILVFAGAAYMLGRSIKQSSEPAAAPTPVHIAAEEATVGGVGQGPDIPALRTPTPARTPEGTTSATTGPTTTAPTTTGATTTGPTTTGPTTTGPTTTGPTTTGPTTTGPTTTGPTTTGPSTTGPTTATTTTG